MASHSTLILNPTSSPITVDSHTIAAGATATLSLSDGTADAYSCIDAGAVLTSGTSPGAVPCAVCQFASTPGQTFASEATTGNERAQSSGGV